MPNTNEEKLKRFEEAIMNQAHKQCVNIQAQMDSVKGQELEQYEAVLKMEAENTIQSEKSEISINATKEISQRTLEYKKSLYQKRDEYVSAIFDGVKAKLATYTQTADYKNSLLASVKKFSEQNLASAVIFLAEKDLPLKDEILSTYGKSCEVRASEDIALGGAILYNPENGMMIDETIDATLAEQKEWFLNSSGFTVEL